MLKSVLIANRSEIARRVIRTAKRLGVRSTLPSIGRVVRCSFSEGGRGGVRALMMQAMPHEAPFETRAGLTPSVTLRVTAPPSRGSGSQAC
jgi:hypothetical protein